MSRITAVFILSLVALGGANAASIFTQVGNDITTDLSLANVGTCTGAGCTPASFTSGTYMNQVFTGTSNGIPSPGPNAQNVTTGTGTTPFVFDSQSNGHDTLYAANSTNSVVVDLGTCTGVVANLATCGLFSIADVYTMIQANAENFGFQGVTISLNGTTANGLNNIQDTVTLTAGVDYRGSSNAAANTFGVICTDANSTGQNCAGQTSDTASSSGFDATNNVATFNNVFGPDTNGVNNFYLDVQELELGNTFTGAYLNSITITSAAGERMLFSGLTLQTATPEPGTIGLLFGGGALLAALKLRRRRPVA